MKKQCFKCKYRELDKELNYEVLVCKLKKCIYDNVENSLNDELEHRKKWNGKCTNGLW